MGTWGDDVKKVLYDDPKEYWGKTLRDLKKKIKDNLDAPPAVSDVGASDPSYLQQAEDDIKKKKKQNEDSLKYQ
jgi:hypothetical protein